MSAAGNGRSGAFACALIGLIFGCLHGAVAAPRAAELGPEVAVAKPSGGYVGRLKVEPANGPVGTPVAVAGEGFSAGEAIQLGLDTRQGSWDVTTAENFGPEFKPGGYPSAPA